MILPPRKKLVDIEEVVINTSKCIEHECPLLEKKKINGKNFYNCGLSIFNADIPEELINNKKEAVLLRIVVAPNNTTRWCGLETINYKEETIIDDTEEKNLFT